MPRRALQLFGDRCPGDLLAGGPEECHRLDAPAGVRAVNRLLGPLRAVVSEPVG